MRPTPYGGLLGGKDLLLAYGDDGHCKGLFWPHKDAFSAHIDYLLSGLIVGKHAVWLDPARDLLQIDFRPETQELCMSWQIQDSAVRGMEVTKVVRILNGEILVENYAITLPSSLAAGLNSEGLRMWFLMCPKLEARRRFQTVYAPDRSPWLFAYSHASALGMTVVQDQKIGFLKAEAAHQGQLGMGEIVNKFVEAHSSFRNIEMGQVLGLACSEKLKFAPCLSEGNSKEVARVQSSLQVCLVPGTSQNHIEEIFAKNKTLILAHEGAEREARIKRKMSQTPPAEMVQEGSTPPIAAARKKHLHQTSLAVLLALTDSTGAMIAAPEMDYEFRYCGGYGFMWPRDSAYCALALMNVGSFDLAKQQLCYLAAVQEKSGDYFQRYDANFRHAPSWGPLQADELGLVCVAFCEYLKHEKNSEIEAALQKAIQKLLNDFENQGHLELGFDLWEEAFGQHFYAYVCAYGALYRAREGKFTEFSGERLSNALDKCFSACQRQFMQNGEVVFRNTNAQGQPDSRIDISMLACLFPISEFPLEQSAKRRLFLECTERLGMRRGYRRYEQDNYVGGQPWILAGFWIAMAAFELCDAETKSQEWARNVFVQTAGYATPAGFFPEQIDDTKGKPSWVLPLAWSHAFYLWAENVVR